MIAHEYEMEDFAFQRFENQTGAQPGPAFKKIARHFSNACPSVKVRMAPCGTGIVDRFSHDLTLLPVKESKLFKKRAIETNP